MINPDKPNITIKLRRKNAEKLIEIREYRRETYDDTVERLIGLYDKIKVYFEDKGSIDWKELNNRIDAEIKGDLK